MQLPRILRLCPGRRWPLLPLLLLAAVPAPAPAAAAPQFRPSPLAALLLPPDPYHALHLPRSPPLHPALAPPPPPPAATGFSCGGRAPGLHPDLATHCQGYHLCGSGGSVVASYLCPNGTLFHGQFQVCDQFYNVRCGSPYEDL